MTGFYDFVIPRLLTQPLDLCYTGIVEGLKIVRKFMFTSTSRSICEDNFLSAPRQGVNADPAGSAFRKWTMVRSVHCTSDHLSKATGGPSLMTNDTPNTYFCPTCGQSLRINVHRSNLYPTGQSILATCDNRDCLAIGISLSPESWDTADLSKYERKPTRNFSVYSGLPLTVFDPEIAREWTAIYNAGPKERACALWLMDTYGPDDPYFLTAVACGYEFLRVLADYEAYLNGNKAA